MIFVFCVMNLSLAKAELLSFEGFKRCNDQPDPAHYDFSIGSKTDATSGAAVSAVTLFSKDDNETLGTHVGFFKGYDASPYAGQTIRLSIEVLADRFAKDASARLFLGVYRKNLPAEGNTNDSCWYFFDNMDNRPFTSVAVDGTLEIIAKIPSAAESFSMGPFLEGNGSILLYNPKIEIVDPSTPETAPYTKENSPTLVNWCSQ